MKKGKEFIFAPYRKYFSYLPDKDRYLFYSDEPKYKFNIIGAGMMGLEHITTAAFVGKAIIKGIYDPNPLSVESAKKNYSFTHPGRELTVYKTLEKACNDPEVDGLIISTPNYTHIDIIRVAAKSGKHIFLEKPMATTIEDAYEITQIAKNYDKNKVFQIGLQYRYKAMYVETIYEALERKSIGDIKMINITEHRVAFLDKVNQWNKFAKYSGQTIVEKCCHYMDLFNLFAQSKPISVFGTGSMAVNFINFEYDGQKSDIYDNAYVIIKYKNGISGLFNLCMFAPMYYEEVVLVGDEGRIKAYENKDFLGLNRPKTSLEVLRGENKPSRIITPTYPEYIQNGGHNGATVYEHMYFIDNIEGKKTDTASTEEGFWSIVVGAAAQESIKIGKTVIIDELLEEKGISL
ncbi:MAG: Gfo/Idh/MocA family protein [Promethearchaeota archaeon]